jgi:hypothetical protein
MFARPTKEFLDGLKVGDEITFLTMGSWDAYPTERTIKLVRRTPKQMVFAGKTGLETKYRADDGGKVGGRFEYVPMPSTDEELLKAAIKRKSFTLSRKLNDFNFKHLPMETLQQIQSIIDAHQKQPAPVQEDK